MTRVLVVHKVLASGEMVVDVPAPYSEGDLREAVARELGLDGDVVDVEWHEQLPDEDED